ncbi:hypothetical protein COO60DRAFT_1145110 [Scenedesmus sp. NREL 46B-D3]|nr:hypothetical protein COO60DRAFT_1145110 [Scenedesmus sp. NREL 46B-D3]
MTCSSSYQGSLYDLPGDNKKPWQMMWLLYSCSVAFVKIAAYCNEFGAQLGRTCKKNMQYHSKPHVVDLTVSSNRQCATCSLLTATAAAAAAAVQVCLLLLCACTRACAVGSSSTAAGTPCCRSAQSCSRCTAALAAHQRQLTQLLPQTAENQLPGHHHAAAQQHQPLLQRQAERQLRDQLQQAACDRQVDARRTCRGCCTCWCWCCRAAKGFHHCGNQSKHVERRTLSGCIHCPVNSNWCKRTTNQCHTCIAPG